MHTWNVRALCCAGALFALVCLTPFPSLRNLGQVSAAALPAYGGCNAPTGAGINICEPGEPSSNVWETSSPLQLIAAATSSSAAVQTMEVWADGKKVAQASGTPFDEPISLDTGTHTITVIEQDAIGNEIKAAPFKIDVTGTVESNCPPPSSPGVNVCSPNAGGCNTQPWVEFTAAGRGASGKVERMELWVDHDKVANFPGDSINTSLIMVYGPVSIVEYDSKGNSLAKSFNFYGPC
jgi:hypothetical protein